MFDDEPEILVVLELGEVCRLMNELEAEDLREEVRGLSHVLGEHHYVL